MARKQPKLFEELLGGASATPDEQEADLAAAMGGRKQPGSGASMYAKGDVKAPDFLFECKQTENASLSVKGAWLEKITQEALAANRDPALEIELKGMNARYAERKWVAVPRSVFERLVNGG